MTKRSPLSKRLKEARLEAGISQKQLGIAIEIDQFVASARMNQYETGKHTPDFSIVQKIAKILNVPASFFYTENDDLAKVIKFYGKAAKKKQREIIAFLAEKNKIPHLSK